jgi:hypothetical protein
MTLQENPSMKMDGRVKPGHDGGQNGDRHLPTAQSGGRTTPNELKQPSKAAREEP